MPYYCVNKNQTLNPGLHHEVHTHEHANALKIRESIDLGWHVNETDAVRHAKIYYYADADGCIVCCPKAHRG